MQTNRNKTISKLLVLLWCLAAVQALESLAPCAMLGDSAVCQDLCGTSSTAEYVTITGSVVDWSCVGNHPRLNFVHSLAPVECMGLRPDFVQIPSLRCQSLTSLSRVEFNQRVRPDRRVHSRQSVLGMNAVKAVDLLKKSSRPITVLIDEKAVQLFHRIFSEVSDANFLGPKKTLPMVQTTMVSPVTSVPMAPTGLPLVASTTSSLPVVGLSAPTSEATEPRASLAMDSQVDSTMPNMMTTPVPTSIPPSFVPSTELAGTTVILIVLSCVLAVALIGLVLYLVLKAKLEQAIAARVSETEGVAVPIVPLATTRSSDMEQTRFDALLGIFGQVTSTQLVLAEDRRETTRMLSQSRTSLAASEFAASRPTTPALFASVGRHRRRHSANGGEEFEMVPLHVPAVPVVPSRSSTTKKSILKTSPAVGDDVPLEGATSMASSEESLPPPPDSMADNSASQTVRVSGNCARRLRTTSGNGTGNAASNVTFAAAGSRPAIIPLSMNMGWEEVPLNSVLDNGERPLRSGLQDAWRFR